MTQQLTVAKRTETGKRRMKRLRLSGKIPAVLYGHGQEVVSLAVPTDQITTAIRHGSHLVDLGGELSESALIKDVVWDTFGLEVLHVDLARVDKTEVVEVTVAVHFAVSPLAFRRAAWCITCCTKSKSPARRRRFPIILKSASISWISARWFTPAS